MIIFIEDVYRCAEGIMIRKIRSSILAQLSYIVILILVVLVGTLGIAKNYVDRVARQNANTLADSLLLQANSFLSLYKDTMRYNAAYICRFSLIDLLEKNELAEGSAGEAILSSYYSQICQNNREIVSALIFDSNMNKIASFGKKVELPEKQRYFRTAEDLNVDWYLGEDNGFYYAYYYPIYSVIDGKGDQIGMTVFIMDRWAIAGGVKNILKDYSALIQLSDSNHLDLARYRGGIVPSGATVDDLRSNNNFVYREGDWQNGIRIGVAVSVFANEGGQNQIRRLLLAACILTVILLGIVIFFTYFQLVRPIREITSFINRAIRNPNDRLHLGREDEIGVVADSLDTMLDSDQKMIEEILQGKIRIYETQLARQRMEILAYRNQINPHFLYNTLSCMRDMALIHDEDDIAEMAMALSDIFRYAVKGSNIVSVRDEVIYIGKYAKIIDYRFMGKIRIEVNAPEEVMDLPVIRLFLQPLVENSVFHGLETSVDPGSVSVNISKDGEMLEFEVVDNGCGMDAETLEKVRESMKNPKSGTGIGLSNIVQRLRLFYEDDYSFTIDSEEGKGTVIRIQVPIHMKTEEGR